MTEQKQQTNVQKVNIGTVYSFACILISSIVASQVAPYIPQLPDGDLGKNMVEMTLLAGAMMARAQSIKAELYNLETLQNISKELVSDSKYKPLVFAGMGAILGYLVPHANETAVNSAFYTAGIGTVLAGIYLSAQYFVHQKNIKKYNENNSTPFSL